MKKALFSRGNCKTPFGSKIFLFLLLVGLDITSKALALRWVPALQGYAYPFGGISLVDLPGISFSLNIVVNTGMAWGLFSQFPTLLLALRLCIIAALIAFLVMKPSKASVSLCLVAAGALGNVIDMFWYGCVIDFLHFRFFGWSFPIFNLADSLITIGAALLFLWPKSRDRFSRSL